MAKKAYIGVSVIPNPPPISSTSGWTANQNTTVSVSGNALRVVSNQSSSTPGVYTNLSPSIPSGTYVTLTYTIRGNVSVAASLWNTSSNGILTTDYYSLSNEYKSFSISGTLGSLVNRLYFFMTSPTTSSWFEVGEIKISYSVARKIKKGYIGVSGVARKIKKAYIGVGGVARPCWSGEPQPVYWGAGINISPARYGLSATSVGDYAIFGGGHSFAGYIKNEDFTNAYNSSLSSVPIALLQSDYYNIFNAATTVGNYALFGGGRQNGSKTYSITSLIGDKCVTAFNSSLSRSYPSDLDDDACWLAATTVGNYALFGGGSSDGDYKYNVTAYNTALTKSLPTILSSEKNSLAATTVGGYALFGGGYKTSGIYYDTVDSYNTSLTKGIAAVLSVAREFLQASTVGNYAIFAGGSNSSTLTTTDAYNTSLTKVSISPLSVARIGLSATTLGNYVLFGGGEWTNVVDVYDSSLTKQTALYLSNARAFGAATTIGEYALFGGGYNSSSGLMGTLDVYVVK